MLANEIDCLGFSIHSGDLIGQLTERNEKGMCSYDGLGGNKERIHSI